jgi:hypothetical protein
VEMDTDQNSEDIWTDEEHAAISAHIEEGYLQSVNGEITGSAQSREEIQAMKDFWRLSRR